MSDYQPHQYVSMELEVTPVTAKEFDLYLSLKFTPQWQNLGKGRLQLSLLGGTLRLRLDQSQMMHVISQCRSRPPPLTTTHHSYSSLFSSSLPLLLQRLLHSSHSVLHFLHSPGCHKSQSLPRLPPQPVLPIPLGICQHIAGFCTSS